MTPINDLGQPVGEPLGVTLPRPLPPLSPMTGTHVTVRPLDIARDRGALFDAFARDTDGRNWTYLPYGPFLTESDFGAWLDRSCTGHDPLFHTITDRDGRAVGLASYLRIDPANGVIEVGHIHLSPLLQRTPGSTEAMFLMMAQVFDDLGYRRYEWKCDALNGPSRATAERLGFTYEGTFRQATHYKGRNRDTAWYALIDSDWHAQRDRFLRWLEPANFHPDGRQRRALSAM